MSTIDIGIADTPRPVQTQTTAAPPARPVTPPAAEVDDGFYVGSVKIEPAVQPRPSPPAVKAWSR